MFLTQIDSECCTSKAVAFARAIFFLLSIIPSVPKEMRICSQFTWEFSVVSKCEDTVNILCYHTSQAPDLGEVLPEKLGGGLSPASQNPCPIYDQKQRFFPTLLMT